ncbi:MULTISPECIES: PaaI family thioesterase [Rhodomicrobium]|uniref:PaaI family thioesterase n=1 Tax=Rhodomicrobium TaxID=1068 RepID=UPI000B4B1F1A|nr:MULTISPECIES: PaaI family thioesterase [Rhodomicrobium]
MTDADFAPIDAAIRKALAAQGFMQLVGARLDLLAPGRAVMSLERRSDLLQQHGLIHGGAIAFLIDNTATVAAATLIDRASQSCLTAEYKLNFVSPANGARLVCEASVLKPGRRLSVVEAKVTSHADGGAKLCAVALATIAVIEPVAAA